MHRASAIAWALLVDVEADCEEARNLLGVGVIFREVFTANSFYKG